MDKDLNRTICAECGNTRSFGSECGYCEPGPAGESAPPTWNEMKDNFIAERIVFSGDTFLAGEGKLSPNPLEYAHRGTSLKLTEARAHIKEIETLVREMWEFIHPVDRKLFVDRPEVEAILEKVK